MFEPIPCRTSRKLRKERKNQIYETSRQQNVNDSVYAPRTTLSGFIFGYLCLYSPVPYNISRFYNDYACSQHLYHQKPRSANHRPDARSLRRGSLPRRTDARLVPPHPPVFQGLKSLTLSSPLQTSLLRCAAGRISIYSPHLIAYGVVSTTGLRAWFLGANLTSGRSFPIRYGMKAGKEGGWS
ncbi:hypothetical protein C8F01DRAFT_697222 [Mycena amicta]|nr:hypothetical protein C8F01DRAFT_697222 [Mycena amicta]